MQTSRFQLGLIATLAVGLGFSLASTQAVGYPAGAAVSSASNPVQSYGGTLADGSAVTLDTLPADQDFVVTDLSFTAKSNDHDCLDRMEVVVSSAGVPVGSYLASSAYARDSYGAHTPADSVKQSMVSGLRISAGGTLELQASVDTSFTYYGCSSSRSPTIYYTVSGYYAQP